MGNEPYMDKAIEGRSFSLLCDRISAEFPVLQEVGEWNVRRSQNKTRPIMHHAQSGAGSKKREGC